MFGGVERESGKTFLVPILDRSAETLKAVIDAWIEPGTTVISDCWGAYRNHDAQGYTHLTVNHSIEFVDQNTGAHTYRMKSTWSQGKGLSKPVQPEGGLHLPPCPLHVRGEVQGGGSGPIYKIPARRRHN